MTILLVEDHIDTLTTFAKFLRTLGHVVHTADGYQAAMDLAKKERFDLAVCDINLWDGDGCDLFGDLQKLQPMRGIAVTGYTLEDETHHYRDSGFSVVLRKPVQISQITSAISQLSCTDHTTDPSTDQAIGEPRA